MQRQTVTFATIETVAKKIARDEGISEGQAVQNLIRAYGEENINFSKKLHKKVTANTRSLDFVGKGIRQKWPLQAA